MTDEVLHNLIPDSQSGARGGKSRSASDVLIFESMLTRKACQHLLRPSVS